MFNACGHTARRPRIILSVQGNISARILPGVKVNRVPQSCRLSECESTVILRESSFLRFNKLSTCVESAKVASVQLEVRKPC